MSDRRPDDEMPARGKDGAGRADEAALAARLGRLSLSLDAKRSEEPADGAPSRAEGSRGWAQAMRISSEFIAGILVGGGLGWLVDKAFGSSPFGLAAFLMLGFAAGVLNVLRATGQLPHHRSSGPNKDT
jgi:ATP synthase protein I